jgi:hypothetical protein
MEIFYYTGILGLGGRRRHQRQALPKIVRYKVVPREMILHTTAFSVVIRHYVTGNAVEINHANNRVFG